MVFLLKKSVRLVVSLLLFSFFVYGLLTLTTGDPAIGRLRASGIQAISPELVMEMRDRLGINGNFWQQYVRWLVKLFSGDFGRSFMTDAPVLPLIIEKSMISLHLIIGTFLVSVSLSFCIGIGLGNTSFQPKIQTILTILLSFPVYWVAIFAIFIFGVTLGWVPFIGSRSPQHFILPIAVLSFSEGSYLAKMIGDLVEPIKNSERQVIARFRQVNWRHRYSYQVKELVGPLLTLYGNSLTHLISGTMIIEMIFSMSGLGKLLMEAISSRDYPLIQGITLLLACTTFVLNYGIDLLIETVDRRINVVDEESR